MSDSVEGIGVYVAEWAIEKVGASENGGEKTTAEGHRHCEGEGE